MKKTVFGFILVALHAHATAQSAVEKNAVLQEQLVGNWLCETEYKIDQKLISREKGESLYCADGTFHSVSEMVYYDVAPYEFTYRADIVGTWQVNRNIESTIVTQGTVERAHSAEMSRLIAQNAAVKSLEEDTYQALHYSLKEIIATKEAEHFKILEISDKMLKGIDVSVKTPTGENAHHLTTTCRRI